MMRQGIRSGNTPNDISSILVALILASTLEFTSKGGDKSDAASGNGVSLGMELRPSWVSLKFATAFRNRRSVRGGLSSIRSLFHDFHTGSHPWEACQMEAAWPFAT